jgi:hypothetical protein
VYNETTEAYDQDVSIDGVVVSRLSYSKLARFLALDVEPVLTRFLESGLAKNFYTEVECQDEHRGAVNAHKYINTTITLARPDLGFGMRLVSNKTAARDIQMEDRGRVWKIPRIDIEATSC